MSKAYTIRQVHDLNAEWERIGPLFVGLDQHHAEVTGRKLHSRRLDRLQRRVGRRMEHNENLFLVAETTDRPIGMAMTWIQENPSMFKETVGMVGDFYVIDDFRGTAIVREMHELLEGWLRERGIKEAQRTTLVANERALKLWQHFGYKPFSVTLRKVLE